MPRGIYIRTEYHKKKISKGKRGKRTSIETEFKKGHKLNRDEKGGNWKGNEVGYMGIHLWLHRKFGKANKCENSKCLYPRVNKAKQMIFYPKLFQWAKLRGKKYQRKKENFTMLCVSCHVKYDMNLIDL